MQRLRLASLLFLSVLLPAILVRAQTPSATPSQDQPLQNHPSAQTLNASAQTSAPPIAAHAHHMSKQTRYQIIHDFETQLVYARTVFPMGTKGIKLKDGVTTPNGTELQQDLAIWGPAVRPGDPSRISFIQIKDDHIHFEINGGPVRRQKWYQRIQLSGNGGVPVTGTQQELPANPHGTYLDVYFDKYVPEMTAQQLREVLLPVLDFNAKNKEEAYLDTVPPKVKEAIQAHHVLVGMDTEMVLHAKGKAPRKVRERDGEIEYEEWIYGEPPADVDFVRIVNDEVVRVETMKVGGEKIVRTEKEVIIDKHEKDRDTEAKKEPEDRPANAPSLRRPGEDPTEAPQPEEGRSPLPIAPPDVPPPSAPGPPQGQPPGAPGGPGYIAGQR
jgi:hypothetical protein